MNIVVLDYSSGKVFYMRNLPFDECDQVEDFLYNKNDYEPAEIAWMEVEDFYKQFEVGDYDEQVY